MGQREEENYIVSGAWDNNRAMIVIIPLNAFIIASTHENSPPRMASGGSTLQRIVPQPNAS